MDGKNLKGYREGREGEVRDEKRKRERG